MSSQNGNQAGVVATIKYDLSCRQCGYRYAIEVFQEYLVERCPICGRTAPLQEFVLGDVLNFKEIIKRNLEIMREG